MFISCILYTPIIGKSFHKNHNLGIRQFSSSIKLNVNSINSNDKYINTSSSSNDIKLKAIKLLKKSAIIFLTSLIIRVLINEFFDINVFLNYTHPVSLVFYGFISTFSVYLSTLPDIKIINFYKDVKEAFKILSNVKIIEFLKIKWYGISYMDGQSGPSNISPSPGPSNQTEVGRQVSQGGAGSKRPLSSSPEPHAEVSVKESTQKRIKPRTAAQRIETEKRIQQRIDRLNEENIRRGKLLDQKQTELQMAIKNSKDIILRVDNEGGNEVLIGKGFRFTPSTGMSVITDPAGTSNRPFDINGSNQPFATNLANYLVYILGEKQTPTGNLSKSLARLTVKDLVYLKDCMWAHGLPDYKHKNTDEVRTILRNLK